MGVTGFNSISKANRIGHIGYWLGEEYSGRGIMTRAVRALTDHGFATLELNRITIAAAVGNTKSRAIAERCGFRLEGIARGAEWLYDHFVDHAIYAITRADWEVRQGDAPAVTALRAIDLNAALELWQATDGIGMTAEETPDMLAAFLNCNPGISSAAIMDDRLVGAVMGGHDGRRGYLYHLAVAPEYRGRGLARRLIERTTAELVSLGLSKATIMVYSANPAGQAFWQHLGWDLRNDLNAMQIHL